MDINEKFEELYEETKLEEHCGECEMGITEEVSVKEFDALKKGDTVTIEFKSPMSTGKATFKVTAKNVVGKARIEKVTLKDVKRPSGVKFFLYKRGNKVSLAQGDMAASVVSFMKEDKDLEKMVKELEGASKMHLGQSKRIAKYLETIKDKKEEVKLDEILKPGAKVKVPHPAKGKGMVTGKIVRYDKGGPHSPFYVVDIGEPRSEKIPAHKIKEEVEIKEYGKIYARKGSDYELYHKTFSGAMQHAYDHAKKKGFTVDPDEIDNKVATGPKKPSKGKTNRYILGTDKKKKLHVQVANLDNKRYELNMYIESAIKESALGKVKNIMERIKPEGITSPHYPDYVVHVKMFPKTLMDGLKKIIPGVKLQPYEINHKKLGRTPGIGITFPNQTSPKIMIQWNERVRDPQIGKIAKDPKFSEPGVDPSTYRANDMIVWINEAATNNPALKGKVDWYPRKEFEGATPEAVSKRTLQYLKTKVKRMAKEEVELDESGHTDVASAKTQVKVAKSALQKMEMELSKLPDEGSLPSWWTNKVAIAVDKLDGMADYLDTQVEDKEFLSYAVKLYERRKDYSNFIPFPDKVLIDFAKRAKKAGLTFDQYQKFIKGTFKDGADEGRAIIHGREIFKDKEDGRKKLSGAQAKRDNIARRAALRKRLGLEQVVVEREMTDAEMKKREEIVMSLKKKMPEFVKRYGDKAKEVMYATATKMAMGEEEESKSKKKDKINLKPKMDETMKKYKDLLKGLKEKKLDPVNKDAVKKKFKNRKDKDIDNDGDVDSSDEYLHKRRKAISKATGEGVEVDGRKKGYKEAMKRIYARKSKYGKNMDEAVTLDGVEYGEQDFDINARLENSYPNLDVNYAEFMEQGLEGPYLWKGEAYFFDRKVNGWYSVSSEDYVDDAMNAELGYHYTRDGHYKKQFAS